MDLDSAGLREQPFPTHGKPLSVLSYRSEREALDMLNDTYVNPTGLCVLQGPTLSGKSTLIRSFIDTLHEDCAVGIIDGRGLNTTLLLNGILRQFGYNFESNSSNELLGLIRVFALQQSASHEPPLLIIENAHEMKASALRTLCELADLRTRSGSALKIVLVSDQSLAALISAPSMESISSRLLHDFHLRPMKKWESKPYLYDKLRAAGSEEPQSIFPDDVCEKLWTASGGWPGILDRLALLALARAETLPVAAANIERPALPNGTWNEAELALAAKQLGQTNEPPRLIVMDEGTIVADLKMNEARMLIGRSDYNDIIIANRFISRHHALLVRHDSETLLLDLNSRNGTYVNANRVSSHVLKHDDLITIGHHNIKFDDVTARSRGYPGGEGFADTAIIQSLDDLRNLLADENTAALPAISGDHPISVDKKI